MSEFETPPQQKKSSTGKIIGMVGCGCLGLIVLVALGGFFFVSALFKTMKSSDAYKDTLAAAQSNPAAIEVLGEPIKDGFFVSGNASLNNGEGTVDLIIPVKGPKGSGQIKVVAEKPAGSAGWVYSTRELIVDGQTIPLGP